MALQEIIFRRLVKALTKIAEPEFNIGPDTVLGGVPPTGLGFSSESLRQVMDELNRNEVGFGDLLLTRRLIQDEVRVSTKVSDLAEAILRKSAVQTDDEYRAKATERVRLGLRRVIAEIAGIDEILIVPAANIRDFVEPTPENKDRIRQALTEMLDKYLLSAITRSDIEGTIGRIQRNIVGRMIV